MLLFLYNDRCARQVIDFSAIVNSYYVYAIQKQLFSASFWEQRKSLYTNYFKLGLKR